MCPVLAMMHSSHFTFALIASVLLALAGCEPRQPSADIIEAVGHKHYDSEEVQALLEDNSTAIDVTNEYGQRALQIACLDGRTRAVALLFDHGANVNATDDNGRTALHSACHQGEAEAAKQLLDAKAQVNLADNLGVMPLHDVVEWRPENIDLIRLLILSGADINAKTNEGETPLDIAVRQKSVYSRLSDERRRRFDRNMTERYDIVEEVLKRAMAEKGP